ncbi:MAG TPA: diguanylate cyclase [Candidatus Acidoferrales bacterium]|jgi:diguanylate cyclase (GGDEF)-like protein/putative nucleotidyltransferase with HDIG domain|nr:diguanylate cyclase [Candidatus Acidoferrales bacterium]
MTSESIIAITLLAASALTSGFFAYMHSLRRQAYLMLWSAGWCLLALHYLSPALEPWMAIAPWQAAVNEWLLAAAALLFFSTAQEYTNTETWVRPQIAAGGVFALWSAAYYLHVVRISPQLGVAAVLAVIAWVFYQESQRHETFADLLLAASFLSWGAILIGELMLSARISNSLRAMELLPQLFAAALMVMGLYEEEKRRVEQNMLALTNVNLETSSFVGPEIQEMLSHALERVLSVVRMPAGALFLHHGHPQGPTSVVAVGLAENFCAIAQEEGLDDHLVDMVSRLGGLVVFRDLGRDSSWTALEGEEAFRRFRQLAMSQRMRTVVGISLQAKEQAFGVLFLGTPDPRRFAAAELRLLLALGHQIGMAVENSYLVQQSSRRTQELHMLNEIGRALSSTLDPDTLFETILSEIKRLFDVSHFCVALHDTLRNEIKYEVEVSDAEVLPKRSRPFGGNDVVEYLMRTRQPILIRENYTEEMRKLGLEPQTSHKGSFCGVPLLLYERPIGAMVLQSPQERALDHGHLEMMRVLASEAVIALENARLFREERAKSRRLSLFNNISRNIITTLNPDEMLAKIAEELEQVLDYSHIGIGLLDYSAKEIVIQAEAGHRKGALGRRLGLDGNVVGRVARTGQMAVVSYDAQRSTGDPVGEPVLEGSESAIALPIIYADQLYGVLYVETDKTSDFPQEEILFLGTLADLISGALHNAMTFQKAQEQAITDGMTGLKTHRFFMEALSAEWKRSTRAGRSFSVVLMDLDRFKFVNDFYGHLDGDLVLQRVAHILELNCRRSDVVARYGGDEFVILMPETDSTQSHQLAAKLRSWISSDPVLREKNVTSSFGVATFPLNGSTPQELIQVADASMYLSKHQGGNAVSTADQFNPDDSRQWKRDVLDAYLGVTLKRLFATGPDAFVEIYSRIEQFARSLAETESSAGHRAANERSKSSGEPCFEPLPAIVMDTLTSLALSVDAKDQFTQGHSHKVSSYAVLIAEAAGLKGPEIEAVRLGGMLHDVGKVGIMESILNKNGPLNPDEWEAMKRHVEYGAKLLEPLRGTESIREMVAHHHEFFDGSGYPEGLSGNEIPLGARMIAIADAYDTITSERTYKKARTPEEAFQELDRCGKAQFDPDLVRLFISRLRELPNPLILNPAHAQEPEVFHQ